MSFSTCVRRHHALLAPGEKLGRRARLPDRLERIDHRPAREVAGLEPAHSVGDRPKPDLRAHQIAVLVAPPDLADMRRGPAVEPENGTVDERRAEHQSNPKAYRPVSISANRDGPGMRRALIASGWKPSPPIVHQNVAPA